MQTKKPLTCESLEEQYKALQDTADEYRAILMSEGQGSEKTKELRTTFDSETENLRKNIVLYKEKQEGIVYLSAEYRSGKEYIEALEARGYKMSAYANDLLSQLTDIPEEQLRLKKVTAEDLGLSNGGTAEEMLAAAKKQGLKPCPPWVGPQYRMECDDDKSTAIGMEPLTGPHGSTHVFHVSRRDASGTWLSSFYTDNSWHPAHEWLFVSDK